MLDMMRNSKQASEIKFAVDQVSAVRYVEKVCETIVRCVTCSVSCRSGTVDDSTADR